MSHKIVKLGIVGAGIIGKKHIENFAENKIAGAKITAVCDLNIDNRTWANNVLDGIVSLFDNFDDMLSSDIDAVLIATPHYYHPDMVVKATSMFWLKSQWVCIL